MIAILRSYARNPLTTCLARSAGERQSWCATDLALSDRMNIIHAVWVDERDMELLAAGTCVAHNPF